MSAVRREFTPEKVRALAINWRQDRRIVRKFIADTGLEVPVLLDRERGGDPSCFALPSGSAETLTEHFRDRVRSVGTDAPFPLQIIIDPEGRLAYLSRVHSSERAITVLRGLVEQQREEPGQIAAETR